MLLFLQNRMNIPSPFHCLLPILDGSAAIGTSQAENAAILHPGRFSIDHLNRMAAASFGAGSTSDTTVIRIELIRLSSIAVQRIQCLCQQLLLPAGPISTIPVTDGEILPDFLQSLLGFFQNLLLLFFTGHIIHQYIIIRHFYVVYHIQRIAGSAQLLFQHAVCPADGPATGYDGIYIGRGLPGQL